MVIFEVMTHIHTYIHTHHFHYRMGRVKRGKDKDKLTCTSDNLADLLLVEVRSDTRAVVSKLIEYLV